MPKVTPEYVENKRREIVDAAYRVCLRKPAEMVTISDVIAETGMSQGAIYRYYNGLDEIFTDMIIMTRKEYNLVDRIEPILSDESLSLEKATYQICDCLADVMEEHIMDIQKINFDFGVIAINEPERFSKIMSGLTSKGSMDYLGSEVFPKLMMGAGQLGYKLNGSPEELLIYIASTYTGIEKYCIMGACYSLGDLSKKIEPRKLFRTYAKTLILLCGGDTNA